MAMAQQAFPSSRCLLAPPWPRLGRSSQGTLPKGDASYAVFVSSRPGLLSIPWGSNVAVDELGHCWVDQARPLAGAASQCTSAVAMLVVVYRGLKGSPGGLDVRFTHFCSFSLSSLTISR